MRSYVPCLKLKQNEVSAAGMLITKYSSARVVPLFDIPRPQESSEASIAGRIATGKKFVEKDIGDAPFYLDNFDLDEDIAIAGNVQYQYVLDQFAEQNLIPVVGLHRDPAHNAAAITHAKINRKIAVRFLGEDVESYRLSRNEIQAMWANFKSIANLEIHVILDFRIINKPASDLARQAHTFIRQLRKEFVAHRLIVTSSSISPFIRDIVGTRNVKTIPRHEWTLWKELLKLDEGETDIWFGDYGTISPDYTDLELEVWMMQNVAAPKVFYTYDNNYFVCRGGAFKTHADGYGQYFTIADIIVAQKFYRLPTYSYGEKYIHDRSSASAIKPKNGGSPGSWLKATLVSHMTFTCNNL